MFNVTKTSLEINERFFEAVALLKQQKVLSGLYEFSTKYHVVRGNLYTIKSQKNGAVKAEYLHYLVRDYGISAEWLLTGEGNVFKQTPAKTSQSPSQETDTVADSRK